MLQGPHLPQDASWVDNSDEFGNSHSRHSVWMFLSPGKYLLRYMEQLCEGSVPTGDPCVLPLYPVLCCNAEFIGVKYFQLKGAR